jgi:hypothetical protein
MTLEGDRADLAHHEARSRGRSRSTMRGR